VVPVLATIVALSILAGATRQQLLSGAVALAVGAVLFVIAVRQKIPSRTFYEGR